MNYILCAGIALAAFAIVKQYKNTETVLKEQISTLKEQQAGLEEVLSLAKYNARKISEVCDEMNIEKSCVLEKVQ